MSLNERQLGTDDALLPVQEHCTPVNIAFFDTQGFERASFEWANQAHGHRIRFLEPRLTSQTALLAEGSDAVCSFVNDRIDRAVLRELKELGIRLVALRCAGFNHVDLAAARELGISVVRVPAYSPHAVAEHAVALLLTLNRKIHRAHSRIQDLNFSLNGLVGFNLHGKTVGVVGTGRIGEVFARILLGFGCYILAHDLRPVPGLSALPEVRYAPLDEVLEGSDVVSLHVPLTPASHHLIDASALSRMKAGALLINTGRGGLVDSHALVEALKSGHLGGAALDVYEEEENVFFRDLSDQVLQDDTLARLLTFPNVLITAHQGFLTREALQAIAETTLANVTEFARGETLRNRIESQPEERPVEKPTSWRSHAEDAECLG